MAIKAKNKIKNYIGAIGEGVIESIRFAGFAVIVFFQVIYYLKHIIRRRHEVLKQMYNTSIKTLPVISVVAVFTGMILTLQTGVEMRDWHMESMVGNILIATLSREMGPFVASIIIIAAGGSTMAAEIGTMKVSEEIDALEMMTIKPVDFLVMPRVVGMTLVMPIATVFIILLGVMGGAIIAKTHLSMSFAMFYKHVLASLWFKAVYVGLLKATVFGMIISTISCANGLRAENGAIGVGRATRDSVVASFLMTLVVGYYITEIFYSHGL